MVMMQHARLQLIKNEWTVRCLLRKQAAEIIIQLAPMFSAVGLAAVGLAVWAATVQALASAV
jgi:hypothetical protein